MAATVVPDEERSGFSELQRRTKKGEETIVTRNGEPVAKVGPRRNRVGGYVHGEVVELDPTWWHGDDELADDFGI
jgi:antitoxin (DNA-binding transcriptional repressor) of toxin-antitoxin stability system